MQELSHKYLSATLRYENGNLIWLIRRGRREAGAIAGWTDRQGYINLWHSGRLLRGHRVIWLLVRGTWPNGSLDHINGIRSDNRIENLRIATKSQNTANAKVPSTNTSGFKGVKKRRNGKWQACITVNKKRMHLGTFSEISDAADAYSTAAKAVFGEFANIDRRV